MQRRTVTDTVRWTDGTPAVGALVSFELEGGGSFTVDETIFPKSVQAVADALGTINAELWCNAEGLTRTYWRCTLPTGEIFRFVLVPGTGSVVLRTLRENSALLSDKEWERLKTAAAEYSLYRPVLQQFILNPAAGTKSITEPDTLGVESCDYGTEFTFTEVLTATAPGWCYRNGVLYLTPTTVGVTINVVWRKLHTPDELTRSFPTIPGKDQFIIDMLANANKTDEEQAAIESGVSSYTIGGTTVKWGQQGGVAATGTTRAIRLRQQALSMLSGPLADWG